MANAFRLVKRFLGIGKERYFVGHDLIGNRYYQFPNPAGVSLRPKRQVEFEAIGNDHTLYHPSRLPPQWAAWLAFTRQQSPTIEELQADHRRQQLLQHNVRQLELARSAKQNQDMLPAPSQTNPLASTSSAPESGEQERVRKWNALNQSPLEAFLPATSNPDDQWAPQSWTPTAIKRHNSSRP